MNQGPLLDANDFKKNLGWYCDVCGRYRKDRFINVYTLDFSRDFKCADGTIKRNFKYCNDSRHCHTHIKMIAESAIYKITHPI